MAHAEQPVSQSAPPPPLARAHALRARALRTWLVSTSRWFSTRVARKRTTSDTSSTAISVNVTSDTAARGRGSRQAVAGREVTAEERPGCRRRAARCRRRHADPDAGLTSLTRIVKSVSGTRRLCLQLSAVAHLTRR
jgi:hypothetical protein